MEKESGQEIKILYSEYKVQYSDCEICGKATVLFIAGHPCHDECSSELIKKYPELFSKAEVK